MLWRNFQLSMWSMRIEPHHQSPVSVLSYFRSAKSAEGRNLFLTEWNTCIPSEIRLTVQVKNRR